MSSFITALLGGLASGVLVLATLALGRTGRDSALLRLPGGERAINAIVYTWPLVIVGIGYLGAEVWSPHFRFPTPEFYQSAAEINVLLLLGLLLEDRVIMLLTTLQRVEYTAILLLSEAAALGAVSGSFSNAEGRNVGGSYRMTAILSTLTIAGLLSASALVVATVFSSRRGEERRLRTTYR